MKTPSIKPHRHTMRLRNYDYSQSGAYFVTLCIKSRECLLGDISNGKMCLNHFGQIVSEEWENSRMIRPNVELDEFVVMPNHIHGIVIIHEYAGMYDDQNERAHGCAPLQHPTEKHGCKIAQDDINLPVGAHDNTVWAHDNTVWAHDNTVWAHGCAPLQHPTEKHGCKIAQDDINLPVGAHSRAPGKILFRPQRSLGSFMAGFKSVCTKRVNILRRTPRNPLWQRNYYEHIIRYEDDLNRIRQYIQNNPADWGRDELFV